MKTVALKNCKTEFGYSKNNSIMLKCIQILLRFDILF